MLQNAPAPGVGADFGRRQVGALCVIAWKADGHGPDRDLCSVIEGSIVDPHPVAKSVTGAVVKGDARFVDAHSRRLSRDQDARRFVEPDNWARAMTCPSRGEPVGANRAA